MSFLPLRKNTEDYQKLVQLRCYLDQILEDVMSYYCSSQVKTKSYKIKISMIPAYTIVYELATKKPSLQQKLYTQFKQCLFKYWKIFFDYKFDRHDLKTFVRQFNSLWQGYMMFTISISKRIFSYLDRYYLPAMEQGSLFKLSLKIFKEMLIISPHQNQFFDCYVNEMKNKRDKMLTCDQQLLKFSQAIAIIDSRQLFQKLKVLYFIQAKRHYQESFEKWHKLQQKQFFSKINNLSYFENILCQMSVCFNEVQKEDLKKLFSTQFVVRISPAFLQNRQNEGFVQMFESRNVQFMRLIFRVYNEFSNFQQMRNVYYKYILQKGEDLIRKEFRPQTQNLIVDKIYNFYKQQIFLVSEGFQKQKQMFVSLNNAIQNILLKIQKFTQIFCKYCQTVLQNNKFKDEKQKITIIFQKLSSKDQFLHFYQDNLIKKIFLNKIDVKVEEEFILYLNQICGNQVTHKLVKKLRDYQVNQEEEFSKLLLDRVPKYINLNVKIISLHLWEKRFNDQLALNMNLAQPLNSLWKIVQQNYVKSDPKRKLVLLPFQNKLVLSIWFNTRKINFKCNVLQACIFFYLSKHNKNGGGCLQEQLISSLSVQKSMLQSIIQTFYQLAPGLINKSQESGYYSINWNFWKAETQIDIDSKIFQSKKIIKAIQQDREILLQAAIVKHMKKTKKSTFEELVQAVNKAIKLFKPQPPVIKASIEKLIKKGYIESQEQEQVEQKLQKQQQGKETQVELRIVQDFSQKGESLLSQSLSLMGTPISSKKNINTANSPQKSTAGVSSSNIKISSKIFLYIQ